VKSLDPRINRLPEIGQPGKIAPIVPLDQFGTFEVFVQPKEGKPFQHEGIVHAPNLEMAYILAKETFTRRFLCTSLCITDTRNVYASTTTEGNHNVYDTIGDMSPSSEEKVSYELYHLLKRGKQHIHAGTVTASNPPEAMFVAKQTFKIQMAYNIWAIRTADIRFTTPEEVDLWLTLPEKKFRDASDYKGGDKLKEFLERNNPIH
jgi:ring-1,2-phenylacetyl-CoA epoxidase subunit PaaB